MYTYRLAELIKVIDGDTVRAQVDLGCDVRINLTLRLARINAPEIATDEGKAARDHLATLLAHPPANYTLRTIKDRREKYGRYLAEIDYNLPPAAEAVSPTVNLNDQMVADGHAVPYDGR